MKRGFGWLPDLPRREGAGQDWTFDAAFARAAPRSLPVAHSNRHLVIDVLDQLTLGACVPCAGFQAIRMSQVRQGVTEPALGARLMGYYLSRAAHGMASRDSGTHLRTFFWAMNRFGFCAEADYPFGYDIARFAVSPPPAAYRLAHDRRSPTRYWAIPEGPNRVAQVKRAVAMGYGVCFGVQVSEDFSEGRVDPTEPIDPPRLGRTFGHAMLVEAYAGDGFRILNSWGEGFGDQGRCTFSADYLVEAHSMWVVELAPQ